jgi:hypothetical protein
VIGDFAAASAPPASAAEAGSAAALILAREDAGILETAEAEPVAKAVAAAIGEEKLGQLRQVWREAHATADDDARGMVRLGRRWCRILGVAPDQPAPKADPSQAGGPPSPVAAAVGESTARVEDASKAEFAPPPPFPPGAAEAREAEGEARRQAGDAASRVFDRDPADGSCGTTGVTREPHEDEQAAARRLARALREASAGGRAETTISSATPPGRLRMRHAMAADAQRAAGAMPTAKPFTRVERRRVPAPPLAVGVACDVSGSMSAFTGPVASAAWVLARATASLPAARTATVTYGRQVRPVTYPGAVPARVAEFSAAGNREDFTTAVNALDGALGLSRPGLPLHEPPAPGQGYARTGSRHRDKRPGKEKARIAEKRWHLSLKVRMPSCCLPVNCHPSRWRELSCQVRAVIRGISVPRRAGRKTATGIVAELLDFTAWPEQLSSRKHRRRQIKTGIAPENRKRSHHHGTHQEPRPRRGPQRRRHRDGPGPRARSPGGGRQTGSGRPGRAVGRTGRRGRGVIAGGSAAVARQALIAHEKAGTAVRLKGGRTGVPETWQPVDGELARGPDRTLGASSGDADRPVRRSVLGQVVVI